MSNYKIDKTQEVHDPKGQRVGKLDYDGQVRDAWKDKGKIEDDRYIDEYGRDHGWVKESSSSNSSGDLGGILIVLLLAGGIFYLIYLGLEWLIKEGKKSRAHASRSWGILSLLLPPLFFLALKNGYCALNEIATQGGPSEQEQIAKAGLAFGYIGGLMSAALIIGAVIYIGSFDFVYDFFFG